MRRPLPIPLSLSLSLNGKPAEGMGGWWVPRGERGKGKRGGGGIDVWGPDTRMRPCCVARDRHVVSLCWAASLSHRLEEIGGPARLREFNFLGEGHRGQRASPFHQSDDHRRARGERERRRKSTRASFGNSPLIALGTRTAALGNRQEGAQIRSTGRPAEGERTFSLPPLSPFSPITFRPSALLGGGQEKYTSGGT